MALALNFERIRLKNGLTVIFHADRTLPLVTVNLWYGVGSKEEPKGRTGFAHLFEHLMFMGTERVPDGRFDEIMEASGGSNNASTSEDRTNYYSTGPSHLLPVLLWLEADRLESLGMTMTQEKLDLQRDVVRNERRQSYENQPYGKAWLLLPELLWPKDHPYAHPVIGSHSDLEAATVEDVKDFFASWYVPSNASLVVAGDFDRATAEPYIRELFESIPDRPTPPRVVPKFSEATSEVRVVLEDEVPLPRVTLAWRSPAHFAEGDAELDLAADVLADGPASRLYRELVVERRVAQDVAARQDSGTLGSIFYAAATALPGVEPAAIESAIAYVLDRFFAEGPSAEELERVVNKHEAGVLRELQDIASRADLLNMYQHHFGDPGVLARDLDRYRTATPEAVRLQAKQCLDRIGRTVLTIVPKGAAKRTSARDLMPTLAPRTTWRPPVPESHATLGEAGPRLWHLFRPSAGLFSLKWMVPLPAILEPRGLEGSTSLMAELLTEGTGAHDSAQLAAELDRRGTLLRVHATRFALHVNLGALVREFDSSLDLLAEIMLRPALLGADFERKKQMRLAEISQRGSRPAEVAMLVGHRALREARGVRGAPVAGYAASVGSLQLEHMQERYAAFRDLLVRGHIVSAGGIDPERLLSALESRFSELTRGHDPEPIPAPKATPDESWKILLIAKPEAPQTVIRFLKDSDTIRSPDLAPLVLCDHIFGGSFTSRLNQNLREEHGFTYGAASRLAAGRYEGTFTATSNVNAEVTTEALSEMIKEMDRLAAGEFEAEELEKALASYRSDVVKAFEAVSDAVEFMSIGAEAEMEPDGAARLFAAMEGVTLADLARVGPRLGARKGVLVLVGEETRLRRAVDELELGLTQLMDVEGRPLRG